MRKYQSNVLFLNKAIMIEIVNVKGKFYLCLQVRVVHPKQAINELFQVNIIIFIDIHHREESFSNDPRNLRIAQNGHFVYPFIPLVRLLQQVLINVLKIRNSNRFLKIFVQDKRVLHHLNLRRNEILSIAIRNLDRQTSAFFHHDVFFFIL